MWRIPDLWVIFNSFCSSKRQNARRSILSKSFSKYLMRNFCLFDVFRLVSWAPHNFVNSWVYLSNTHLNQIFQLKIVSLSLILDCFLLVCKVLLVLLNYFHMVRIDQLVSYFFSVALVFVGFTVLSKLLSKNGYFLFHWWIPMILYWVVSSAF